MPIAINVGDILLGEGYRLLSLCDARALTAVAADAHIATLFVNRPWNWNGAFPLAL